LAKERGVILSSIVGTGPGGRVTVNDVETQEVKPLPSAIEIAERIPLVGMRKRIAERMSRSAQTAPHISVSLRIHMDPLESLRESLNMGAKEQERVTITAALVKVVAKSLSEDRILIVRYKARRSWFTTRSISA
jgi:pyruvate/2-oxoglutarate dehydrogenase complex dihydrolipoamide acyltransferase (E2) component